MMFSEKTISGSPLKDRKVPKRYRKKKGTANGHYVHFARYSDNSVIVARYDDRD